MSMAEGDMDCVLQCHPVTSGHLQHAKVVVTYIEKSWLLFR